MSPWPPPAGSSLHAMHAHATRQLKRRERGRAEQSRPPTLLPTTPALPIPLSARPCRTMVVHVGRLRSVDLDARVRISLVSMFTRSHLPPEVCARSREIARDRARSHLPVSTCQLDASSHRTFLIRQVCVTFLIWQVCVTAQIWTADLSRQLERALLVFERASFLQEGATGPVEAQQVQMPPDWHPFTLIIHVWPCSRCILSLIHI